MVSSRFWILSWFNWFLRFSMCFCLRIRDRRADSRFDIIRLRLRSSAAESSRFGPSEPEFECKGFRFGPSEQEFELTGFLFDSSDPEFERTGSCDWKMEKSSWLSQGVKPPSKDGNGLTSIVSDDIMTGKLD